MPQETPPSEFETQWGVVSPWGTDASKSFQEANRIATNMRSAGNEARVVWRAVSAWQEQS